MMRRTALVVFLLVLSGISGFVSSKWNASNDDVVVDAIDPEGIPHKDPKYPCGVVVVSMASSILGKPAFLNDVKNGIEIPEDGQLNAKQLIHRLDQLGFESVPFTIDPEQLDVPKNGCIIAHVHPTHWVLLNKNSFGIDVLLDPPRMPERLSEVAKRDKYFTGVYIAVFSDGSAKREYEQMVGIR